MRARLRTIVMLCAAAALASCGDRAPSGGEKELALATATTAGDVVTVTALLASGADPNKVVRVSGSDQSPWILALNQLRPRRPETVDIVKAMVKSGASLRTAWGTSEGRVDAPRSFWRSFMRSSRMPSFGSSSPLRVAMFHPVPEVVRLLTQDGFDPRDGQAALVAAIESGETEIAHILVDAGVDVNCRPTAVTPLVAAIEARDVALMTYLESHGAREKP